MKPISTTELPSIKFDSESRENGGKFIAQGAKIGWIHSLADVPGVKFDIVIKDALGRLKLQKRDCGGGTERFGELLNLSTLIGEELDVRIENVRGAKRIDLFLN